MSGYEVVKQIARERPEWLDAVRACYGYPHHEFAGKWILEQLMVRTSSSLRPLITLGLLEKSRDSTDGGSKGWYRIVDRDGVGRALAELG
jgi:hypothetical protein